MHVAHDERGGHQLDVLAGNRAAEPFGRVDRPVQSESLDRTAGLRINRPEPRVARRKEDARILPVGPVRDAPRVEPGVGGPLALPGLGIEGPQRFAGGRVDGGGLAHRRLDIEHAVHHDRRRLERRRQDRQLPPV